MTRYPLLQGYSPGLLARAESFLAQERALERMLERYPERHAVRSNRDLFTYVQDLKARHLRSSPPLAKVSFDPRMRSIENALGLHITTRVAHGDRLRKRRELKVASLFRSMPAVFLRMIVVHELAHMKHADHDRAFYRLCSHMEPDYHQLEFDLRILLSAQDSASPPDPASP